MNKRGSITWKTSPLRRTAQTISFASPTNPTLIVYPDSRKIKNKAIVNRDPKIAELLMLRKENAELKANLINNGSNVDVTELNTLRQQVETLKSENEALLSQLR